MKILRHIVAICVLAVMSKVAVALPMEYKFDVYFTTGYFLGGTTVPIFVTLEGVRGIGSEVFRQNTGNLLAFRFRMQDIGFDLRDALDWRPLPKIALQDGKLVSVIGSFNYLDMGYTATFNFTPQVNQVRYQDRYFGDGNGKVIAASWPTITSPVPAPASLALVGLGLAGLSVHRRKRPNRSSH